MTIKMLLNQELNGVELYFPGKPEQKIIDNLKENSFRWSGFKKCWYAKQNETTLKVAQYYVNGINSEVITAAKKTTNKTAFCLWTATTWNEIEVNNKQATKDIAKEIRQHVKVRFPMVKFSVTSSHSSISFYITASPYEKESIYLEAIKNYCTKLIEAYRYCTCYDPYGDYGSSYNFYGAYAKIDYDYKQLDITEELKNDMQQFDIKKAEFEKAEEEKKELEWQQREKEAEEKNKQYKIKMEIQKQQKEVINRDINIVELEETQQYFVINSEFAKANKNNTLDEYKEEVAKGDYYSETVKITKEVHFSSLESLEYFSNMLLHDFDFLAGTGGSYTDDVRINSMSDYNRLTKEERETVIWNLKGVAIYYNNKLQFVVDTQGHTYARYVGLVNNATIQKNNNVTQLVNSAEIEELKHKAEVLTDISVSVITDNNLLNTWHSEQWQLYKQSIKEQFKKYNFKLNTAIVQQIPGDSEQFKIAMYKLLSEVEGVQEQFKDADIKTGQRVTIFKISGMGMMQTERVTIEKIEPSTYAQYKDVVKLTYKPQNKKSSYYGYYYKDFLVFEGWHDLPTEVLNIIQKTGSGVTITSSKYLSCDNRQYDAILEHFNSKDIQPIINTYKPNL